MGKRFIRSFCLALSVILTISILPFVFENDVNSDSGKTYSKILSYDYTTENCGKLLIPDKAGSYDPVILVHGLGGIRDYPQQVMDFMNTWVSLGLIEPCAVILPEIKAETAPSDCEAFRYYADNPVNKNKTGFLELYAKIKDGSLNSKINKDAPISFSGFSFGGACAVYAGLRHNDKIVNVGGLSPARAILMFKWSWEDDPDKFVFSGDSNAHLMMAYGMHESKDFMETERAYAEAAKNNGKNVNEFIEYAAPIGSHDYDQMEREFFAFLYYIQKDELPSPATVAYACGYENSNLGTVTISGTAKAGSKLSASVSGSKVSFPNFSYQWMRNGSVIKNATSSSYTLTSKDEGTTITCYVSETNGQLEGYIKASVSVKKADVTTAPVTKTPVTQTPVTTAPDPVTKTPDPVTTAPDPVTKAPDQVTTAPVQPSEEKASADDKIGSFVERNYEFILGREGDTEGIAYWTSELKNFNITGAVAARQFVNSPEFTNKAATDEEYIIILYKTFFDRDPDQTGLDYWKKVLKDNPSSRNQVAEGFINSQEWADTCASYGIRSGIDIKPSNPIEPSDAIEAFVERMYSTALKRESDPTGKAFWADKVANFECTGETIGLEFFISSEMEKNGLDNEEFVIRLYKTFMDRDPDSDGLKYWVNRLDTGDTRKSVVLGFTRSQEFVQKCIDARILPY